MGTTEEGKNGRVTRRREKGERDLRGRDWYFRAYTQRQWDHVSEVFVPVLTLTPALVTKVRILPTTNQLIGTF